MRLIALLRDTIAFFSWRELSAALAVGVLGSAMLPAYAQTTLLNVSYDPTRELYQDFNAADLVRNASVPWTPD